MKRLRLGFLQEMCLKGGEITPYMRANIAEYRAEGRLINKYIDEREKYLDEMLKEFGE